MKKFSWILIGLFAGFLQAQNKKPTIGVVVKPIVPVQAFRTKLLLAESQGDFSLELLSKPSISYGMSIRQNFGKTWAIEGGLFQTRRNYQFNIQKAGHDTLDQFLVSAFEIPLMPLIYIQLSKQWYTFLGSGLSFHFIPSQAGNERVDYEYLWVKNSWLQLSSQTSVGMEYRTKKSGYFYAGLSYQVFFKEMYDAQFKPLHLYFPETITHTVPGNYVCVELKYFFSED